MINHRFLKRFAAVVAVFLTIPVCASQAIASDTSSSREMYRLYNAHSGEHFYTASVAERNSLRQSGWRWEGVGWVAPAHSSTPVYRLYNPNAGDHHYTLNANEKNSLVRAGWRYEGVGWYSSDTNRNYPLYREYNPHAKAGAHNYTLNRNEHQNLVRAGWRSEGIAWYGIGPAQAAPNPDAQAENIMRSIANTCRKRNGAQQQLACATNALYKYVEKATYTMSGTDYAYPRGFLVLGVYSCAGTARAGVRTAQLMGYPAQHINENQYTHQWAEVQAGGKTWQLDPMVSSLAVKQPGSYTQQIWTCNNTSCTTDGNIYQMTF